MRTSLQLNLIRHKRRSRQIMNMSTVSTLQKCKMFSITKNSSARHVQIL